MKNTLLSLAAIALCAAGCNKEINRQHDVEEPEGTRSEVTFSFSDGRTDTRSATAASEEKVNSLQVLVFNPDGVLDSYGSSDSKSITLTVTTGKKMDIYAMVNGYEDLSDTRTKQELLQKGTWLNENTMNSLAMIGSTTETLTAGSSVTIPVTRFVGKVQIDGISVAFKSPGYASLPFKVKSIYLINACGSCLLTQSGTPELWYNQREYQADECDDFLYEKINDVQVTASRPFKQSHYFYTYPNQTLTDTSAETWSPRYTRLVIEATLGDTVQYYPINIVGTDGKLSANHLYRITNATITGPGSNHPDILPEKGSIDFDIIVVDWEDGFNREETF